MDISIQITKDGDSFRVAYQGPINEEAEVHLTPLISQLGDKVVFNFRDVEYVNSCGVRGWINFMRDLTPGRSIVFEECTAEIVMQINMIPSFKGSAEIRSVYGPYECPGCGKQERVIYEQGKNLPSSEDEDIPEVSCPSCGTVMEMEELEDEFFAFVAA